MRRKAAGREAAGREAAGLEAAGAGGGFGRPATRLDSASTWVSSGRVGV